MVCILLRFGLDTQLATGRGCGQLSSITPGRGCCDQTGCPFIKESTYSEGYIMIGKAEEEGDDETLQTDQDNGE